MAKQAGAVQGDRGEEQEGRRRVPRRERQEARRQDAPQRAAIQGHQGRHRPDPQGDRRGQDQLPRHPDRWHGVRQSERRAGDLPGQPGDRRLDRGPAIDEGGIEVATLRPRRARLWRQSEAGRGDRPERHARLRHRAARHRAKNVRAPAGPLDPSPRPSSRPGGRDGLEPHAHPARTDDGREPSPPPHPPADRLFSRSRTRRGREHRRSSSPSVAFRGESTTDPRERA